jgi:hypothetical protein
MRRCAEILWSIRKDYRELVVPTSAMNWSSSSGAIKWAKEAFHFALQGFFQLPRVVVNGTDGLLRCCVSVCLY